MLAVTAMPHQETRRAFIARVALWAILAAPSLWMLATVPPLWKDIDAYLQVTRPPDFITIIHYGPGYCFGARLPLYLGTALECLRNASPLPSLHFFAEPTLTDGGVRMLLWWQHAALWCASWLVITGATRSLALRLALAVLWAANPLFYVCAQLVGTEALSVILLLLLAGTGIRLALRGQHRSRLSWAAFILLAAGSMLTRHVNGVVAALLPIAFGGAALARLVVAWRQRNPRARRWLQRHALQNARLACVAIAAGVAAILLAQGVIRLGCRAAGVPYHQRVGFSFQWRLNFLGPLTQKQREPVLARAAAHCQSAGCRSLLDTLRTMPVTTEKFDTDELERRWRAGLPPDIADSVEESDAILNEAARAFLIAPSRPYLRAVAADCLAALRTTAAAIDQQFLRSTAYGFAAPERMPQLAGLETYRNEGNRAYLARLLKHPYLARWHWSYRRLLLITSLLGVIVPFGRGRWNPERLSYTVALLVVGFLSVLGNNLFNELQTRYTLPAWVLGIVALTLVFAAAISAFRMRGRTRTRAQ